MNGKKARKLRRLALDIANTVTAKTDTELLSANPKLVYKELKVIDKSIREVRTNRR